jgi:chaperonin GroEL
VVAAIKGMAREVKTHEDIANVASISAADKEIGNLLAEVMDKVG